MTVINWWCVNEFGSTYYRQWSNTLAYIIHRCYTSSNIYVDNISTGICALSCSQNDKLIQRSQWNLWPEKRDQKRKFQWGFTRTVWCLSWQSEIGVIVRLLKTLLLLISYYQKSYTKPLTYMYHYYIFGTNTRESTKLYLPAFSKLFALILNGDWNLVY